MTAGKIKNTLIYLLPVIVGNIIPIITIPFYTRKLSTAEYGLLTIAQVYAIFLNGIANFGLMAGYERFFFESNDSKKKVALLYSTIAFVLLVSFFFAVMTLIFGPFISQKIMNIDNKNHLLFWSFAATSITGLKVYFLSYFKNSENAKSYVWYTIDETIITTILSLIFLYFFNFKIFALIYGQLISGIIIFFLLILKFVRKYPLEFDLKILMLSLKFSVPLTPKIFFGVIGSQIDKYILGLLGTLGGVGVYNIAQKIANVTFTFMTAIQNVFAPQVYKKMFEMEKTKGAISIGLYLTPFLYISLLVAFSISLFSEEIVYILLPSEYYGAINIISIFTILYASYFFSKHPQLLYAKRTGLSSILFIVSILLNLIINIQFIKTWGVLGAGWGSLLSGLIWGILYFLVSQKYYFIKWEWNKIGPMLIIFFMGSVVMVLIRYYEVNYVIRLAYKAITLSIFIWVGRIYQIISYEKFVLLRKNLNFTK